MPRIIVLIALVILLAACRPAPDDPPPSENWQRIDGSGRILSAENDSAYRCLLDTASGLMWQIRSQKAGLHHQDNRYSWYNSDQRMAMGEVGLVDAGHCDGSDCDTESLVEAVNRERLCAAGGWRLPTREELLSLGEARRRGSGLIVDDAFFPGIVPGEYWTSETFRLYPQSAWAVDFSNGLDRADYKHEAKSVRLVRRHSAQNQDN